jgi:hypothetical protein
LQLFGVLLMLEELALFFDRAFLVSDLLELSDVAFLQGDDFVFKLLYFGQELVYVGVSLKYFALLAGRFVGQLFDLLGLRLILLLEEGSKLIRPLVLEQDALGDRQRLLARRPSLALFKLFLLLGVEIPPTPVHDIRLRVKLLLDQTQLGLQGQTSVLSSLEPCTFKLKLPLVLPRVPATDHGV